MNSAIGVHVLLLWFLASGAFPQPDRAQDPPAISGTWTATVGDSQTLRGRWIGQSLPHDSMSAHGSWTLTGPSGKTALTGTWSARKSAKGWQGTWSAKAVTGRGAAGTWEADLPSEPNVTIQDFLERLSKQEIAGTWRSGRLAGSWWLKGKARPSSP